MLMPLSNKQSYMWSTKTLWALREMASYLLKQLFHIILKRPASSQFGWDIHFGD